MTWTVSEKLIALVQSEFALPSNSIHGATHWARVRDNGLRLAKLTGANPQVVALFAVLHDSKRLTDSPDPGHGKRAAEFIQSLRGSFIKLPDEDIALLAFACEYHTDGLTEAHVTIQTCWDADRLDLGRANIKPDPRHLCTSAAKDPGIIKWAYRRSRQKTRGK